jgi:hypothetical protein
MKLIIQPLNYYWYCYVFEKPFTIYKFWCRIKGHPNGMVYYNPNGWEPDNHCKDCGDLL